MQKGVDISRSPIDQERQLKRVMYMLIDLQYSVKRTAIEEKVSPKTIGRIIKKYNLKDRIAAAKTKAVADCLKNRDRDSLTAFYVTVRSTNREFYKLLEPVLKNYLNKI